MNKSTQVLVIGGGPAGSTTATLLAREGIDVTLLEREIFPRYHIGESLLPSCLAAFNLLGIKQTIDQYGFQLKEGVFFSWGDEEWDFPFTAAKTPFIKERPYSFQVVRAEFDDLLLKHAKSQGVKVVEGTEVINVSFTEDRPCSATWSTKSTGEQGEISFQYLVDASGRTGVIANRYLKSRVAPPVFQNVAVWRYWSGAKKLPKGPTGAIAVVSIPYGWIWGIPLHNGTFSVGVVMHKDHFKEKRQNNSLEDIYQEALQESPLISDLLEEAELASEVKVDQDYSYVTKQFAGPGYFLVGDAACFLDPLLSTGVHLATTGGIMAAASLLSILRGEVSEQDAQSFYQNSYQQNYLRLLYIISGLYEQYRGQQSYFWDAQRLSTRNYNDDKDAFVQIVSGLEDLRDIAQTDHGKAAQSKGIAETDQFVPNTASANSTLQYLNEHLGPALRGALGAQPNEEAKRWCVTMSPRLGLRYM